MIEIRMRGPDDEIEAYLDMIADQQVFFQKMFEPMKYKDYVEHTMKMSNRTVPYNYKELENADNTVLFIKVFKTQKALLEDCTREKKYKEKLAAKERLKTVRTSTGITYGGKRQKREEQ